MSIIYLDTSALIKRYVQEEGSDELTQWINAAVLAGTAAITYAEMSAALAKVERMKWISSDEAYSAWQNFLEDYPFLNRQSETYYSLYYNSEIQYLQLIQEL